MIYPDWKLEQWAKAGGIRPYDPECLNPASIDLKWSGSYCRASSDGWEEEAHADLLVIQPGDFFLLDTMEYITMRPDMAGFLMLKSTLGRIGFEHQHAGFFDPAFHGTATLEVTNTAPWPVEIVAGQRIVQLVVMAMTGRPTKDYRKTGRYNGQRSPQAALPQIETAVPEPAERVTPASPGHVLSYVLTTLEHHHMSRPGISVLVKNAQAMLDGRKVTP